MLRSEPPRIRWARSATKHRVGRARSRHVIEHATLRFRVPPPAGQGDDRVVYLGRDAGGIPLEVVAIEVEDGGLFVIHAMPMRRRYVKDLREVERWQG